MLVATTTSINMKGISLVVIGVLLTAASSIYAAPQGRNSLKILQHLQDCAYVKDEQVIIVCQVENATSYLWYKDGKLLEGTTVSFEVRGWKLFIRKFSETDAGVYQCVGKDGKGNFGKTAAKLLLEVEDPLCRRQRRPKADCIPFDEDKCPHVTDFAPKAENVEVEIQADYTERPWPSIWFLVKWNVPKLGRRSIWGWQIIVNGLENSAMYEKCYQVNLNCSEINSKETIQKDTVIRVPLPLSTYVVEVQSLPYTKPYSKGAVKKIVKTPGWCNLRNIEVCCESYVNASLVSNHSRTSLSWTTYYPPSLNVTVDAFIIVWTSIPLGICKENFVVLDSTQSNYTFPNLTYKCGRNYTIQLVVRYASYAGDVGCDKSQPEVLFYTPPVPTPKPTLPNQPPQKQPSKALTTAGFTIAAILGGIVIVSLIYLWKKRKGDLDEETALGMENKKIRDSRIASSSFWTGLPPQEGRLNCSTAWSANENDKNQWIQVDLGKEKVVTAIATQGRKNADQWVGSYFVSYSLDREKFERYQINGEDEMFSGNDDKNTVVTNVLSPPINARYIRIHPQSWCNHISMRMELYGRSASNWPEENVRVFILNPNHCELCTEVVQTLAGLLMETGHIRCEVDIFAPMRDKCQGLARWTQEMIFKCDYVIIPWMCEINQPKENICINMSTLTFLSSLDIIHGELVRNRNKRDKFIPVCLDHCPLDIIPPEEVLLQIYNIPSKIDDLAIELLGKTRRPEPNTILEFDDEDYITARNKLTQVVNKMEKNHPTHSQKNSDTSEKKKKRNNNLS